MNPSPIPVPVTVVAAPPEWWQVIGGLSPLAVLVTALVAAVIGLLTLRQKAQADNRSEWWHRAQWALDASMSANSSIAEMGQRAIAILGRSELATTEELRLLKVGTRNPLSAADPARRVEHAPAARSVAPPLLPASAEDRNVQLAAAEARVALDRRLGEDTPGWISALAQQRRG
ncbi:hypothetical protein AB6813_12620 [bacterium RCC_150]